MSGATVLALTSPAPVSLAPVSFAPAAPARLPVDLLTRYNSYFHTSRAGTQGALRAAQAIRYQVYCLERKFEDRDEHQSGHESDAFDTQAVHSLIFHRPTSEAIGTTRLILRLTGTALPIEGLLAEQGIRAGDHFPLETAAEVSRFAISNNFRRDAADARGRECRSSLPCLGLIQELLRQSVELGLTHWTAVMEPKLLRMLAAMGIHFTPVGPIVSHHGLRQPSYCHLPAMLERLKRERPEHWMVVTDAGRLIVEEPQEQMPLERRAA